jgi:ferric-dicitrate binding protein FerR (iron transport regulator)
MAFGRTLPQAPQAQDKQPLGSLSPVGDVSVNGMAVNAETTVFSGDSVRTAMNGTATFTMSGKGSIKLSPQTQVTFSGTPDYLAELNAGAVVMNSFAGSTDVTLKLGNYVVGPVIQVEQSASKVQRMPDGSYVVSCLDGSVGLVPLEGATGSVLQAGQSVPISAQGQLGAVVATSALPAPSAPPSAPTTPPTAPAVSHSNRNWILLGLAGAAGGGVGITLATRGSGSKAVSPASP